MVERHDDEFREYVLAEGVVPASAIEDCLVAQAAMKKVGIDKPLSDVMVEKGLLERDQARKLVAKMRGGDEDFIPGYRIVKKLGDGAMGRVYKAVQLSSGRDVALKVLFPRFAREERFVQMFKRECDSCLSLEHKNLVRGYDAGVVKDRYFYYAMEFVEGTNLRKRYLMLREKASEYDCLTILFQMGQALEYAGKHRFVHRDIKPDNIIITAEGVIKLCDLGLLKQVDGGNSLTQTGLVVGTPYYISPEQGRGRKDLDSRSDMYSLGATLYHVATGKVPFDGDEPLVVIEKHVSEPLVPPHLVRNELSLGFSYVLWRMMAKERDGRYADGTKMLEDVQRVMQGKDPSPDVFRSWKDGGWKGKPPGGSGVRGRKERGKRATGSGKSPRSGPKASPAMWALVCLSASGLAAGAYLLLKMTSGGSEGPVVEAVDTFEGDRARAGTAGDSNPRAPRDPRGNGSGNGSGNGGGDENGHAGPDGPENGGSSGGHVEDPPAGGSNTVDVPPVDSGGPKTAAQLLEAARPALARRGIAVRAAGGRTEVALEAGFPASPAGCELLDSAWSASPAAGSEGGLSIAGRAARLPVALAGNVLLEASFVLERPVA
ncbi:MAG: serine/threonine protein kinase, partial [Planctomycetes bacterium]|nr:serine/threonine protein kinase [Planctomycetota bacterium]